MSIEVIRGTNDKPAASGALASTMAGYTDLSGDLFIGYPIVNTPEGHHPMDALLVSPDRGLVVFDLIEGTPDGYEDRQDDSANKLEARLRAHRSLVRQRKLCIPIHTVSFRPSLSSLPSAGASAYPLADQDTLHDVLLHLTWDDPNSEIYKAALSAIETVSSIRKSRAKRTVTCQNSRGAKLKRLEDSIATLDATQGQTMVETVDGVQRIRGLAGSGKTIVLALKAAYLHAQHPNWRIAVTFNTRSLKPQFRRLINTFAFEQTGQEPDWENLRIINAWGAPGGEDRHGLYFEFCRRYGLEYLDFRTAARHFRGREFWTVCKLALNQFRSKSTEPCYDAILVDEAQDLPDTFLQICYELLRPPRRLVYAYDELQNLTENSVSPPEKMFGLDDDDRPRVRFDDGGTNAPRRDLILKKCYRNALPVLVTAHALGFGIYRKPEAGSDARLIQMFDSDYLWQEIGYECGGGDLKGGSPVMLRRTEDTSPKFLEVSDYKDLVQFMTFASKDEQDRWVAEAIVENIKRDELRHQDIIVINPDPFTTRKNVGAIRAHLFDLGVASHLAGVDTKPDVFFKERSREDVEIESVTFTGVHRAKGNEGAMVYVVNSNECDGRGRNLASIRNRLFVAITRAKAWVRVVGVGDGMQVLAAEHEELVRNDFELRFTYPTQDEREHLRVVHRDMSEAERRRARKYQKNVVDLADGLESGEIDLEDMDAEQLARLRTLLASKRGMSRRA